MTYRDYMFHSSIPSEVAAIWFQGCCVALARRGSAGFETGKDDSLAGKLIHVGILPSSHPPDRDAIANWAAARKAKLARVVESDEFLLEVVAGTSATPKDALLVCAFGKIGVVGAVKAGRALFTHAFEAETTSGLVSEVDKALRHAMRLGRWNGEPIVIADPGSNRDALMSIAARVTGRKPCQPMPDILNSPELPAEVAFASSLLPREKDARKKYAQRALLAAAFLMALTIWADSYFRSRLAESRSRRDDARGRLSFLLAKARALETDLDRSSNGEFENTIHVGNHPNDASSPQVWRKLLLLSAKAAPAGITLSAIHGANEKLSTSSRSYSGIRAGTGDYSANGSESAFWIEGESDSLDAITAFLRNIRGAGWSTASVETSSRDETLPPEGNSSPRQYTFKFLLSSKGPSS